MQDERIQTTMNRSAAMGFFIWNALLAISLLYRMIILRQDIRDFWDIFAIWGVGMLYVFIANAHKGGFAHASKRYWLTIFIVVFVVNATLYLIMGRKDSVATAGGYMICLVLGTGSAIGMAFFLSRRWRRKEGIEDEE